MILFSGMLAYGFDTDDLKHLEKLSSPFVLRTFPLEARNLKHNVKADVVKYLNGWATALEAALLQEITLTNLKQIEVFEY
jgi:hypothetical protein